MLWTGFVVFWLSLVHADIFNTIELDQVASQLPNHVISISNSNLLVLSRPNREHFTLLVLTSTDERHKCNLCIALKGVLDRMVSIWFQNYPGSQYLYFAEVDIIDRSNVDIFQYLGLEKVPQVWLIPPSHISELHNLTREKKFNEDGVEYFDNYDILHEPHLQFLLPADSFDGQVFQLADWLAHSMLKQIIVKQENAMFKFAATFGVTLSAIILLKKRGPSFLTQTVTKGKVYQIIFLMLLLAILGGYSFTTIKAVPFIAKNDKGEPIFISGGLHYQFGIEIILVGAHYFLLGATFVTLVYLGNYKVQAESLIQSKETQALLQIFTGAVLYFLLSSYSSMFLRKVSDYPYPMLKLY